MAMIKCPECDQDISSKAVSCPHCGYPIRAYYLQIGTQTSSWISIFLTVCTVVVWIGGLIIAVSGANIPISDHKTEFSFETFIILFLPYLIYGLLFWCMSVVVAQVNATYDMVQGMDIMRSQPKEDGTKERSAPLSPKSDLDETWKCPKCGTENSRMSYSCKDCGYYR